MEPKAPSPQGGPSPEASGPIMPSPEIPGEVQSAQGVEKAPAAQEIAKPANDAANQNTGMPLPQPMPAPAPAPATSTTDDQTTKTPIDAPDLADDVDVIEKEWVDKAKQIVTANSDDPYVQNHDVSVLKADYMKKRYGKDIKVPEDNTKKD